MMLSRLRSACFSRTLHFRAMI